MKIVNRIKKAEDFALTVKKGKAFRNGSFVIHVRNNNLPYTRVGVSVSSKLGNAVIRNRIKRQIRAMCMSLINFNDKSLDVVIVAKNLFLENDFSNNKNLLSELLKLGRII
jgi:ribonuclease P protein component